MVSTIVKQNVQLMLSGEENGMRRFASQESHGGNAGFYKANPCVGVNFQFEANTGKIIEFTNEVNTRYSEGIFRLVFKDINNDSLSYSKKTSYPKIISHRITRERKDIWGKQPTAEAEAVIKESVALYNECCDKLEQKKIMKW